MTSCEKAADVEDKLEDIRSRLEHISEELGDIGMEALREALDAEVATTRPEIEKRLSRARRAVDKAAAIISGGPQSTVL
jgi:predicted PP-loop superfamily ATPase